MKEPQILFGLKIAKLRKKMGLSQIEMAEKIGLEKISYKTLQNYEQGKTFPDIDKIIILADFFKCTVDDLLEGNFIKKQKHTYREAYRALIMLLDNFTIIPVESNSNFNMLKNKISFICVDPNIIAFIKRYISTLELAKTNKKESFDYYDALKICDDFNGNEEISSIKTNLKNIINQIKK